MSRNEYQNKGGRPPKEVKKERRVSIACSVSELRLIQHKAEQCGLSLSQYGLRCMLERQLPQAREELVEIRKLTGMANNLNQIARSVHSGEGLSLSSMKLLEELSMLVERLKR